MTHRFPRLNMLAETAALFQAREIIRDHITYYKDLKEKEEQKIKTIDYLKGISIVSNRACEARSKIDALEELLK